MSIETHTPLISIIVPVYNVERYLRQCLESIVNQNFNDYEVIVVDDGSIDSSPSICDEYCQRFEFVKTIHKNNGGLSDARNSGLKLARGLYIMFIDADDYIEINSLPNIADTINECLYTDIIFLKCSKVFDDMSMLPLNNDLYKRDLVEKSTESVKLYLSGLSKYPASACIKAVRKELLIKNGLFFECGLLCEDLDWSINLFLAAKTYNLCEKPYYYYRQSRTGSISNTYSEKKFTDILKTVEKWSEYVKSDNCNKVDMTMICSFMAYIFPFLLIGYDSINDENKVEYKNNVKKYKWLLSKRKGVKTIIVKLIYNFGGIKFSGYVLKKFLQFRRR